MIIMNEIDLVDFHAHILPGVDHGSDSLKTSLEQLSLAKQFNVNRIVASSHFYPHQTLIDDFLKIRERGYELLKEHLTDDLPSVKLGCELLLFENIVSLKGIEQLCVSGTNVILLELPYFDLTKSYYDSVKSLIKSDFDIVLAHADRYEFDVIERLLEFGVKIQLNASAIDLFYKKRSFYKWIEDRAVVALGSDIHGANKNAYKHFDKAKNRLGDSIKYIAERSDKIWNCAK